MRDGIGEQTMENLPLFPYVGSEAIREANRTAPAGTLISSRAEFAVWTALADWEGPLLAATYTITPPLELRLADRHSEHIACAGGAPVLAAGELFTDGTAILEITNQSTGYCPDLDSWHAVAAALDRDHAQWTDKDQPLTRVSAGQRPLDLARPKGLEPLTF